MREAMAALHLAADLAQVQQIVRAAARRLVSAQGATFVLREGDLCYYADEDAISPLWKGQRFPVEQCISGWAMVNRRAAVVPDIRVDDRIPQAAYQPTFVRSLAMIPIQAADPVGAIGVYWARPRRASEAEVAWLTRLAEATAAALQRLRPGQSVDSGVGR
jgi:GAF domain-containing protein